MATDTKRRAAITLRAEEVRLATATAPDGAPTLARIQVAPIGVTLTHPKWGELVFDAAFAAALVANFARYQGRVPLDYDHGTNGPTGPEQGIAAGWIKTIKIEGDAVVAYCEPTKRGRGYIEAGEYVLASPTIDLDYTDPESGEQWGPTLLTLALTNRPFIRGMEPASMVEAAQVALRVQRAPKEQPMAAEQNAPGEVVSLAEHKTQIEQVRTEAKSEAEKTAAEHVASLSEAKARSSFLEAQIVSLNDALAVTKASLNAAQTKLVAAETEKAHAGAEAEVDALIEAGKVTPAQRDAMIELCKLDHELFARLTGAQPASVPMTATGVGAPVVPVSASARIEVAKQEIMLRDKCDANRAFLRACEENPGLRRAASAEQHKN